MIAVIMIVAAVMRFYSYHNWSLSNDELSALNRLQFDSFADMIRLGVLVDFHPAGVQTLLWFITHSFGFDVWIVRLPFVLFGTLSVYYTFLIGKRWFGINTGLFAAAVMAFLEYPVLFSQLARPYSPGMLFSVMGIYYWSIIVFDAHRKLWHYLAFAFSAALALYSHHISFLLMLITGLSGFLFYHRLNIPKYLAASVLVFLLYLPHIQIFFHQFSIGGVGGPDGWLAAPEPDWILKYLWYAFNESMALIIILIAILIFSIIRFKSKITKFHTLSISLFAIMFLIAYFYSIWRNPILQYSILLFSFPLLVIFIFSFLNQKITNYSILSLFLILTFGITSTGFINKFYQKQHFGEFKKVAENIAAWNKKYGKENISNMIVVNGPYYIHYYLDQLDRDIGFLQYNCATKSDLLKLSGIIDSVQTPYFIYGWTKPSPKEIDLLIRDKYPCIVSRYNYAGLSEVSLYGQKITDSCIALEKPVFVYSRDFDEPHYKEQYGKKIDTINFLSSPHSFQMDSITMFSPGFKQMVGNINNGDFDRVEVELAGFSPGELKNTLIVFTLKSDKETYFWRGSEMQNFVQSQKWGKVYLSVTIPEFQSLNDELNIYAWNPGKELIFVDNLEVRFYSE